MIRCIFEDRLQKIDGQIVRVVNASWCENRRKGIKAGNMDVFREYEDGREEARANLCYVYMGGYLLDDPEHPAEWGKPWMNCKALKTVCVSSNAIYTNIGHYEIETVKERHPGFRWMLDKILANRTGVQVTEVMEYLKAWLLWPECERLYNGEYYKLTVSRSFAQATYRKQCEIMQYLKQHPEIKDPGFGEILALMKSGLSQDDYHMVKTYKCTTELLKYLHAQLRKGTVYREEYSLEALHGVYKDYISMAKVCGHDVEDGYWKFPGDLRESHDKVMKENARLDREKLMKRNGKYVEAVKKFMGKVFNEGDIQVYVPESIKDISMQAKILHQCLVTADYIGKVIDGKCLLVFLACKGRPLATAELNRNGKLVQFYGDEWSRNMKPGKDAESALNAWCKKFKPKWRKAA
jgi:hypothetical protein